MALEEQLDLDISQALSRIDDVESALGQAVQGFATALVEATAVLNNLTVENVDATAVTTGIDEAVTAANAAVTPEVDAAGVTTGIDEAVTAAGTPQVPVEPDTSGIADTIDTAVASAQPAPIEVPVDAGEITGAIDSALSDVDTSGLQGELDSAAGSASRLASSSTEAGVGIGTIAPAAALASGETGALSEIVGGITPGMAAAAGATLGLVDAGKHLFDAALEQNTALARLRETYGELADSVEHVNFGGVNESLDTLAVRTGANVDGLRNFSASFGLLGKSAGDSLPHVADVSQQIILLAERASVLNPNLGTADDIVQRLSTSLSRGGRFLSIYGIALSTAQINAEALRETGKSTASELTIYDKIVAGATLATQRLGGALGTDINDGAQKAQVQLNSLKAQFEETLKAAGRPLIQPTIDAFRDLEPVLEALARLLGTTLTGALHVVGPLLSGIAAVLGPIGDAASQIPGPVTEAAVAFALFLKVGPILAGALDSLIGFATGSVASWLGIGAAAETAAAETQVAAAEMDAAAAEAGAGVAAAGAEAGAGAAAAGAGAAEASVGVGALEAAFATVALPVALAAAAAAGLGFAYARLTDDSAQLNAGLGTLKAGFANFHSDLEQVTAKFLDTQVAANVTGTSLFNVGLSADQASALVLRGRDGYAEFLDTLVKSGRISQGAADSLRLTGVQVGELNRQVHTGQAGIETLDDGTVKLIATFQRAQETTRDTAHEVLTTAVAHGQLSRAEEVTAISAHTAHDGHVDWIGVLSQLQPRLSGASAAVAVYGDKVDATNPILQTAAQRQIQYQTAVENVGAGIERGLVASGQFTQSQIDTANAINTNKQGTVDYGKALDALSPGLGSVATDTGSLAGGLDTTAGKFQLATDKAKAFQTELDQLLAPFVSADQANVQFHQDIDKVTESLAKNGTTLDLNTKAGQDNRLAIDALVTSGANYIDKLIAQGASTDQVHAAQAQLVDQLRVLEGHYPTLAPLVQPYIDRLNDSFAAGERINQNPVNPQVNPQPAVSNTQSVTGALNDLRALNPTDVHISADGSEAQAVIGDVSISIQSLQSVANANPIHIVMGGVDVVPGSGVTRTPGGGFSLNIGPGAMAGGTFDPWQSVVVGEQGPEVVTFPTEFTVHPHGQEPAAQGKLFENLIVQEVAQNPVATANAVSRELARVAKR